MSLSAKNTRKIFKNVLLEDKESQLFQKWWPICLKLRVSKKAHLWAKIPKSKHHRPSRQLNRFQPKPIKTQELKFKKCQDQPLRNNPPRFIMPDPKSPICIQHTMSLKKSTIRIRRFSNFQLIKFLRYIKSITISIFSTCRSIWNFMSKSSQRLYILRNSLNSWQLCLKVQ